MNWSIPGVVTRFVTSKKVAVRYEDALDINKRTAEPLQRTIHVDVKDLTLIARDG